MKTTRGSNLTLQTLYFEDLDIHVCMLTGISNQEKSVLKTALADGNGFHVRYGGTLGPNLIFPLFTSTEITHRHRNWRPSWIIGAKMTLSH